MGPRWGSGSTEWFRKMARTARLRMEYRNVGRDEDRQLYAYLSNDWVGAIWEILSTSINFSEPGEKVWVNLNLISKKGIFENIESKTISWKFPKVVRPGTWIFKSFFIAPKQTEKSGALLLVWGLENVSKTYKTNIKLHFYTVTP